MAKSKPDARTYSARGDTLISRQPVLLTRYRAFTRCNHWLTAVCMFALLLSGFAFFHPSLYGLTALFGGGQVARWIHPWIGVVLALSFLGMFVQMWRLNLPNRDDVEWGKKAGHALRGNGDQLPEVGKYNAGQKAVFWGMSLSILLLLGTGLMIWEQYFAQFISIPVQRVAVVVHALSALASFFLVLAHVYAAIWTRGTIRAMTRGTVTGGWAFRHHRKWLRELAQRAGRITTEK